jgi:hypothetical protein
MRIIGIVMDGVLSFALLVAGAPRTAQADKATDIGIGIGIGVAATLLLSESGNNTKRNKTLTPTQSARASCKETGGYWTGSTCKASKNAKIGKCKKGYVWSSDAGACQYDGGGPVTVSTKKKPKKVEPWNRPGCSRLAKQCNGGQGNMASCEQFQNLCSND